MAQRQLSAKKSGENQKDWMGEECWWKNVRRVVPGRRLQESTKFGTDDLMPSSNRKSLQMSSKNSQLWNTPPDVGYNIGEFVCSWVYSTRKKWKIQRLIFMNKTTILVGILFCWLIVSIITKKYGGDFFYQGSPCHPCAPGPNLT